MQLSLLTVGNKLKYSHWGACLAFSYRKRSFWVIVALRHPLTAFSNTVSSLWCQFHKRKWQNDWHLLCGQFRTAVDFLQDILLVTIIQIVLTHFVPFGYFIASLTSKTGIQDPTAAVFISKTFRYKIVMHFFCRQVFLCAYFSCRQNYVVFLLNIIINFFSLSCLNFRHLYTCIYTFPTKFTQVLLFYNIK